MKRGLKWTFAGILVLVTAVGVTFVILRSFDRPAHRSDDLSAARAALQSLNLTREQKEKLVPLERELKEKLDLIQTRLGTEQISICAVMADESADEEALEAKISSLGELETARKRAVVRHLMRMREILTVDQRKTFFMGMMTDICRSCCAQGDHPSSAHPDGDCICGHCNLHAKSPGHVHKT